MKLIRLIILALGLIAFAGCVVLLLNITALNPTHRRYSTRSPITAPQASSANSGADAEVVLSNDLDVPRNSAAGQRQCFCKDTSKPPNNCESCAAKYSALTASYRIPDFLTNTLIGESKNRQYMDEDDHDLLSQIGDYTLAAHLLSRPLWIYVRVDTEVDPVYEQLAQATGGDIVYYFTTPGYVDPVDRTARGGLVATGAVIVVAGIWELRSRRQGLKMSIPVTTNKPGVAPQADILILSPPAPEANLQPPTSDSKNGPNIVQTPHSPTTIDEITDSLRRAEEAAKQTRKKLD